MPLYVFYLGMTAKTSETECRSTRILNENSRQLAWNLSSLTYWVAKTYYNWSLHKNSKKEECIRKIYFLLIKDEITSIPLKARFFSVSEILLQVCWQLQWIRILKHPIAIWGLKLDLGSYFKCTLELENKVFHYF